MNATSFARSRPSRDAGLGTEILAASSPLRDAADLDPVMERIGDARLVLIGEASHGTHDYYRWRAMLSRRLIAERGFRFIGVEGDWPDCRRIDRWVRGEIDGHSPENVLRTFTRWPTWMWANWEVAAFAAWLRGWNADRPEDERRGFFGLDVYSLNESLEALLGWLRTNHPEALPAAERAMRCFEPFGDDGQEYAVATTLVPFSCEEAVLSLLRDVRERTVGDELPELDATINAEVVRGAEAYYRAMIRGGPDSWNLRDRHMADTLNRLLDWHGPGAKGIVWAHNTHVGDARFTDMATDGMFNLGQLAREEHADDGVVLVGFGGHEGTVIAGRAWGAPMETMPVPPARAGSWEAALHQLDGEDRVLVFPARGPDASALAAERGHRAIGVVYRPEFEWGNYVPTVLSRRYDAFLYLDQTRALHPIAVEAEPGAPELYPWNV